MKIAEFNAKLLEYAALCRKTPEEVLAKQGYNLALYLKDEFSKLKPAKGQTTAERRAALRSGVSGVTVRKGARDFADKKTVATASDVATRSGAFYMEASRKTGKVKQRNARTWWEIAVDRELAIRESGRGYLSLASRMKWNDDAIIQGRTFRVIDRVDRELSRAGMKRSNDGAVLTMDYSNPNIVEAMQRPKAKIAVTSAIAAGVRNMQTYIDRKLAENKAKAGLN